MNNEKKIEYIWEDIRYVVLIDYKIACIDIMAYEITGYSQDNSNKYTVRFFERKGSTSSDDTTEDINEARTSIDATIKWNICSHIEFGDYGGYLYIGGGYAWRNFIELQKRIFNLAREYFTEDHQMEEFNQFDEKIV